MEACCLDIPGWSTTILDIIERSNDNTSRPREVTVPSSGPPLAIRLARGSIAMINEHLFQRVRPRVPERGSMLSYYYTRCSL